MIEFFLNIIRQFISLPFSVISTILGNLNTIFPLIAAFGIFLLALSNKDKLAIKIMVFLVPFEFYFPFRSNFNLEISINGFIIWATWLATQIKYLSKEKFANSDRRVSLSVSYLYYFLFIGIFLGVLNLDSDLDHFSTYILRVSSEIQILNVSLFILTTIMFIQIMSKYIKDYEFQSSLLKIFLFTSFLHLLSLIIAFGYLGSNRIISVFSSFKASALSPFALASINRYSALLNDYEMIIDYCLIVIVLGFINIKKFRNISIAAIMSTFFIGIFTGTRSFLIALLVLFGTIIFLNFLRARLMVRYALLLFVLVFSSYMFYDQYLSNLPIFFRYETTINLIKMGNYAQAVNRDFISEVPLILKSVSILGNGSFYFWNIENYSLVSHNLLLAMYAKFGIIGAGFIIMLFYKNATRLLSIMRKVKVLEFKDEATLFLALLVTLFVQQIKISFIRSLSTILIYALLFVFLYFFINRVKTNEQSD